MRIALVLSFGLIALALLSAPTATRRVDVPETVAGAARQEARHEPLEEFIAARESAPDSLAYVSAQAPDTDEPTTGSPSDRPLPSAAEAGEAKCGSEISCCEKRARCCRLVSRCRSGCGLFRRR